MTTIEQLERDLTGWFAETAGSGAPDFADEILLETTSIRQRPRWTFIPGLPRPMGPSIGGGLARLAVPRTRVVLVLVLLGLLLLAASAIWAGSGPRLPPPFGVAANGLVAYGKGGDIFVVDPATGDRRGLVLGPERDVYPRWSLDGTRVAFLRGTDTERRLVVVDASGAVVSSSVGDAFADVDPDGIAWAPDGRSILLIAATASATADRAIHLVDALSGRVTTLPIDRWELEAYWRPPDGRELLFVAGPAGSPALFRYSVADGRLTEVPGTRARTAPDAGLPLRPIGWTADGARFAYHRESASGLLETIAVNVETGETVSLDLAFGRIANDGTRIVGIATDGEREWLCVAPTGGGPCARIEGDVDLVDRTGSASFQWAPDDTVIRAHLGDGLPAVLLSPTGGSVERPAWAAEGAESWQRRAR